jgi:hypothetical protein
VFVTKNYFNPATKTWSLPLEGTSFWVTLE